MGNCCLDKSILKFSVDQAEISRELHQTKPQKLILHKDSIFSLRSDLPKKKSTLFFISSETNEGSKFENTMQSHFEFSKPLTPRCSCGSSYIWQEDMLNYIYPSTGNHNILCTEDQKIFSSSGWLCRGCSKVICRSCSELNNHLIPSLYCNLNHQIEYFPDCLAFRYERFKSKYFDCKFCLQAKMEPAGSCRECDFNICVSCLHKNGIQVKSPLMCFGKHELVHRVLSKDQEAIQCCICYKGGSRDRVFCDTCEFNVCFYCAIQICARVFIHPGIQCRARHLFSVESIKKFRKNKKQWIVCLKCNRANLKFVYGCKACEVCLCLACAWEVKKNIEGFNSRPCGNGHAFIWNPVGRDYRKKCSFCETALDYCGYYCEECDQSACVDCVKYSNSSIISGDNSKQ